MDNEVRERGSRYVLSDSPEEVLFFWWLLSVVKCGELAILERITYD
jgi:hypothetical protein